MSLALAIAAATGLNPEKDFLVQDDGAGPFLAKWLTQSRQAPNSAELDTWLADYEASAKEREKDRVLRERALEYLVSVMRKDELSDASALTALKAEIAAEVAKVDVATIEDVKP